jgi:hypothetical protein
MIIVLYFLMYFLLLVIGYLMGRVKGLFISFLVIGMIHSVVLQFRNDAVHHTIHPRYDYRTIYNNVKHGDVIFSTGYEKLDQYDFLLAGINNGLIHCGIIVEENHIKYMIHAYGGIRNKYLVDECNTIKGTTYPFRLYKEPFLLTLIRDQTLMYCVFRHPEFVLKCSDSISFDNDRLLTYCTTAIADLLVREKLIRKETGRVLSYQPDSIMNQLIEKGYESFFMIHERSKDLKKINLRIPVRTETRLVRLTG